jgi:uncharacterized phage protein (TIGR02218 family)
MRSVNSAFWLALQGEQIGLADLIDLDTPSGTYRWTTSNVPIVSSGQTYDPFPGGADKGAEESTDLGVGNINFSVVNSGQIRELLMVNELDFADIAISRVFVNSPDLGRLYSFRGKVADLTHNRDLIRGQARGLFNGVNGSFPYQTYQDYCVWRFGSTGCGINTASYTVATSIFPSSSNALTLLASSGGISGAYGSGRLDRGRLTVLSGVNSGQVRTIKAHSGDFIVLSHPLPYSVASGFAFEVYPGCRKRIMDDCASRYNNTSRALGFPWMPKNESAFS